MKNRPKIVKFRKQNQKDDKSQHYVGFAKNYKNESQMFKDQSKANVEYKMTEKAQIEQKMPKFEHQKQKLRKFQQRFDNDLSFSEHQNQTISSYKKNFQNFKIAMPKGFRPHQTLESFRKDLLKQLKKSQPDIKVEQIFQLKTTKQIIGLSEEQQRKIHIVKKSESDQMRSLKQEQNPQYCFDGKAKIQFQRQKSYSPNNFESQRQKQNYTESFFHPKNITTPIFNQLKKINQMQDQSQGEIFLNQNKQFYQNQSYNEGYFDDLSSSSDQNAQYVGFQHNQYQNVGRQRQEISRLHNQFPYQLRQHEFISIQPQAEFLQKSQYYLPNESNLNQEARMVSKHREMNHKNFQNFQEFQNINKKIIYRRNEQEYPSMNFLINSEIPNSNYQNFNQSHSSSSNKQINLMVRPQTQEKSYYMPNLNQYQIDRRQTRAYALNGQLYQATNLIKIDPKNNGSKKIKQPLHPFPFNYQI